MGSARSGRSFAGLTNEYNYNIRRRSNYLSVYATLLCLTTCVQADSPSHAFFFRIILLKNFLGRLNTCNALPYKHLDPSNGFTGLHCPRNPCDIAMDDSIDHRCEYATCTCSSCPPILFIFRTPIILNAKRNAVFSGSLSVSGTQGPARSLGFHHHLPET